MIEKIDEIDDLVRRLVEVETAVSETVNRSRRQEDRRHSVSIALYDAASHLRASLRALHEVHRLVRNPAADAGPSKEE